MKKTRKNNKQLTGMLFAAPPLIGFILFGLLPMLISLVLSFGHLSTYNLFDIEFVGFDNYVRIITEDTKFLKSIGNTFIYAIFSVLIQIALSLFLSVCLNTNIKFKKIIRIILFIPYVCSMVALSTMWKWILDYNYGVLNDIVIFFGGERVEWLNNEKTAMLCMILMSVWGGLGYNIILYTASLSSLNKSYYEAAEIDGASSFQQFRHITIPLIRPTTFFLTIMGFIGALQSFANFQIMTPDGGPGLTTLTMGLRVYNAALVEDAYTYGMGYASAMSWLVGIIVMIFTAINFVINNRKEKK